MANSLRDCWCGSGDCWDHTDKCYRCGKVTRRGTLQYEDIGGSREYGRILRLVCRLACSRDDDPTEHDAPRGWVRTVQHSPLQATGPCRRTDGHAESECPNYKDTWSRDRDDHDAAVSHFIGRVSPWVRSALAGTLTAKVLA